MERARGGGAGHRNATEIPRDQHQPRRGDGRGQIARVGGRVADGAVDQHRTDAGGLLSVRVWRGGMI